MNNPLGVSPSKGNQGATPGKGKSFDLVVPRSTKCYAAQH